MTDKSNDDNGRPRDHSTLTPIRGGRGDQTEIPGTERKLTEVEKAAEKLLEADEIAKDAKATKDARAEDLVDVMRAQGITSYKYKDARGRRCTATTTSKTTVKVKRAGA